MQNYSANGNCFSYLLYILILFFLFIIIKYVLAFVRQCCAGCGTKCLHSDICGHLYALPLYASLCVSLFVCVCVRVDVVCIIKFVYRTCVERRLTVKTFGNEEIAYLYCYLCCCVCFLPDIFIGVSFLIMRRVCV